ncbi:uncharacterized protein [Procambarus clarkii]|uniref:uncharacterized protein n=1 Tax=Procambarus clarkii TaxID=6728 RepID=UPI003742320A
MFMGPRVVIVNAITLLRCVNQFQLSETYLTRVPTSSSLQGGYKSSGRFQSSVYRPREGFRLTAYVFGTPFGHSCVPGGWYLGLHGGTINMLLHPNFSLALSPVDEAQNLQTSPILIRNIYEQILRKRERRRKP